MPSSVGSRAGSRAYQTEKTGAQFFGSHIKELIEKWGARFLFHVLFTLGYNLSTTGLYINSSNDFFEHSGLIDSVHHPLSEGDEVWEKAVFYFVILPFAFLLLLSNQLTFPRTVKELFRGQEKEGDKSFFKLLISGAAAVFKSVVQSSSLFALLRVSTRSGVGDRWSLLIASLGGLLSLPGTFSVQFSIFAKFLVNKYHLEFSPRRLRFYSHLLTAGGNISYLALYFTGADSIPKRLGWLDDRISTSVVADDGREDWRQVAAFSGMILLSGVFLISNQREFQPRIAEALGANGYESIENDSSTLCGIKTRNFVWGDATTSAAWKTIVTFFSLFGLLMLVFNMEDSAIISSSCLIGNFVSNLSIFAPKWKRDSAADEGLGCLPCFRKRPASDEESEM